MEATIVSDFHCYKQFISYKNKTFVNVGKGTCEICEMLGANNAS